MAQNRSLAGTLAFPVSLLRAFAQASGWLFAAHLACWVLLGFWAIRSPQLRAGPPLDTDDPDTPGPNSWEVNLASPFATQEDRWVFVPQLDINYGVGERIQLKLKPRAVVLDEPGNEEKGGAGSIQLGVKWRFLDQDSKPISMSFYPQADFTPPGNSVDRRLVDQGHQLFLPFEIQRVFGGTKVYSEVGFNWREQQTNEWGFGLAIEHALGERFRLAGELRDVAEQDFAQHLIYFNAGFKWSVHDHVTVLASAGRTLHEPMGEAPAVLSYLGLQLLF